ncbi:MAG: energy transducer TonB, partial [Alistipes sp.]|nr:energy transducer TonB [Alistipes sp.]
MIQANSENNEIKEPREASQQRGASSESPRQRRRPLRLPFDGRQQDVGSWAYDHRIGLCITVIAYLLFAIIFVVSKIVVGQRASTQTLYIDMQTVELLETERDRLEAEVRRANSQIDWSSIRNTSSNENALNENLQDAKGINAAALNSSAEETEARMRANREAYEKGLAEAEAAGRRSG